MGRTTDSQKQLLNDQLERQRIRYQWMLASLQKLRFFFCGLVFAMLSFSIQFQVNSGDKLIIALEMLAWALLTITGYFSLRDCGGFANKLTENVFEGLGPKQRNMMWVCFMGAIVLLIMAMGVGSYMSKVVTISNAPIQVEG